MVYFHIAAKKLDYTIQIINNINLKKYSLYCTLLKARLYTVKEGRKDVWMKCLRLSLSLLIIIIGNLQGRKGSTTSGIVQFSPL